jgi:hypothetical protein
MYNEQCIMYCYGLCRWNGSLFEKVVNAIGYAEAVAKYGVPLRIRSDYATEYNLIRQHIEQERPNVRNPFLTGSSIHNQVCFGAC